MKVKQLLCEISFTMLLIFGFDSCNTDCYMLVKDNVDTSKITQAEAFSQFSLILSRAVSENQELRTFIKTEAMKMFDNDYDVFYPFVKNRIVKDGLTFRELLLSYCDNENQLNCIESAIPKLTILVPDWGWLKASSIATWDPSDREILVGFAQNGCCHTLYANGDLLTLGEGEFPETPTLIVKSNERMVAIPSTRSEEKQFTFRYPEYDASLNIRTKGRAWYEEDINLGADTVDNFVPESDIDPIVIRAYEEFKDYRPINACQRDYIYYGLCKSNPDSGILNTGIRERIYRFRLEPSAYSDISDDSKDDKLHDPITIKGRKNKLSIEKIRELIWSGGIFDFQFDVYKVHPGDDKATQTGPSYPFHCKGSDLFDLSKVHIDYKKQTAFAKGVYVYNFKPENLVSKWVYPTGIQTLPIWDISLESNSLAIYISEVDDSTEIETTEEWVYKYSKNFKWNLNVSGEGSIRNKVAIKIGFGTGGDKGLEETDKTKIVIKKKLDSDFICKAFPEIQSKIIEKPLSKTVSGILLNGYDVRPISAGDISITLLPMDIR